MFLLKHCPACGKRSSVEVPEAGYIAWQQGQLYLAQAMPELTPAQRDTVLTGWHEACVKELEEVELEPDFTKLTELGVFDLEFLLEG